MLKGFWNNLGGHLSLMIVDVAKLKLLRYQLGFVLGANLQVDVEW